MQHHLALLDVDGTLREGDRWLPGALDLVHDLHEAGVHVAVCSGRTTGSLVNLVRDLPDVEYLASSSGATVLRRAGDDWDVVHELPLPEGAVRMATEISRELGVEIWGFGARRWLIPHPSGWAMAEAPVVHDEPELGDLLADGQLAKVLFLIPDEARVPVVRERCVHPGTVFVRSGFAHYDLIREDAARDKGGDQIRRALGLEWSQVIAMGDGENDRGMLGLAGLGVCIAPLTDDQLAPAGPGQRRVSVPDTAAGRDAILAALAG